MYLITESTNASTYMYGIQSCYISVQVCSFWDPKRISIDSRIGKGGGGGGSLTLNFWSYLICCTSLDKQKRLYLWVVFATDCILQKQQRLYLWVVLDDSLWVVLGDMPNGQCQINEISNLISHICFSFYKSMFNNSLIWM